MNAFMPCDNRAALAQRDRADARDDHDEAQRERIYRDERMAFITACNDCALKLPRSGTSLWDRLVDDLLYLDKPENWEKRRAMFNALLSCAEGRQWLADRASDHARDEADSADLSDE